MLIRGTASSYRKKMKLGFLHVASRPLHGHLLREAPPRVALVGNNTKASMTPSREHALQAASRGRGAVYDVPRAPQVSPRSHTSRS